LHILGHVFASGPFATALVLSETRTLKRCRREPRSYWTVSSCRRRPKAVGHRFLKLGHLCRKRSGVIFHQAQVISLNQSTTAKIHAKISQWIFHSCRAQRLTSPSPPEPCRSAGLPSTCPARGLVFILSCFVTPNHIHPFLALTCVSSL